MKLDTFIEQQYRTSLQEALTRWAEEAYNYEKRRNDLRNAGFDNQLIRKFTLLNDHAPSLATELVAEFAQPNFNDERPNFHPLVAFLKYLCKKEKQGIYYLSYTDKTLFNQLIKQGEEKVNALRCRSAVVRIESPKGKAIGTGFFVSQNRLLTCYHVLQNRSQAWVRFNYNKQNTARDTDAFVNPLDLSPDTMICSGINELDYVLVGLQNPTSQVILPLNEQEINSGDNIRIIHHPDGDLATVSSLGKITESSHDALWHDLTTDYGSSGAPIFNENWEIIAIHRGNTGIMATQTTDQMTATPINSFLDKIAPFLD